MISAAFNHNIAGGNTLYMFIKALGNGSTPIPFLYSSSSAPNQYNFMIVPIGIERSISFKVDNAAFSKGDITLLAYRRIGTNS